MNLFSSNLKTAAPLADRMRPETLDDFIGHETILGPNTLLRQIIENDELVSLIFWAPPGTGKTTLAKIIAHKSKAKFTEFHPAASGVKDLKEIIKKAQTELELYKKKTIVFVDEIHRFSKSQQDYFLAAVEKGIIILIGATTENPSFEVNSALLSRCKVIKFCQLNGQNIADILIRALKNKENGFGNQKIKISSDVIKFLAVMANGDARTALNTLEFAVKAGKPNKDGELEIKDQDIKNSLQKNYLLYDKDGEEHYNIISALHKSMRGSDADAALYWLGRMLEAGEDPLYVARRLIRFASEDIGLADPNALVQAVVAYQACHFIGMPECNVILAQTAAYLAQAPKSNSLYMAYQKVQKDVQETINDPVPLHLRNAPTALMKNLGYSKGYKYNPNFAHEVKQEYLPKKLNGKKYL